MGKKKDVVEEFIEKIRKAEEQAFIHEIETNIVILNENYDMCKQFYYSVNMGGCLCPPMILGKEIYLGPLPEKYPFAISYSDAVRKSHDDRSFLNFLKEHIELGKHGQIVLKDLSKINNKDAYDRVVSYLELGQEEALIKNEDKD